MFNALADLTGYRYYQLATPDPDPGDVILNVPVYRQAETFSCGFVAALMVVHCFYPRRSPSRLYNLVDPSIQWGTSTSRFINALRASSIGVRKLHKPKFEDVKRSIYDGYPVVTSVRRKGIEHWIVVIGVRRGGKLVLAGDSWHGVAEVGWSTFSRRMIGAEQLCLVCWGKGP